MDLPALVQTIRDAVPDVIAVYLFGSMARGDESVRSDLDLAMLGRGPLDPVFRWELQQRLAVAAGCDVDLVDLRAASTVLRVQVLRDAQLLFESERNARALFEATALSMYARLNEERRGIIEDVLRSGRIYG
ncbi:MAG TPA: nucleotidyltransferase domain-containing protein [Myxococcales bacterium]|nr:nucleotidyltransferase domain-containing protein [Myxococcales bacterium]